MRKAGKASRKKSEKERKKLLTRKPDGDKIRKLSPLPMLKRESETASQKGDGH